MKSYHFCSVINCAQPVFWKFLNFWNLRFLFHFKNKQTKHVNRKCYQYIYAYFLNILNLLQNSDGDRGPPPPSEGFTSNHLKPTLKFSFRVLKSSNIVYTCNEAVTLQSSTKYSISASVSAPLNDFVIAQSCKQRYMSNSTYFLIYNFQTNVKLTASIGNYVTKITKRCRLCLSEKCS